MDRHDVVQGLYFAWMFLAIIVVPISFTAFLVVRRTGKSSKWLAAGVCSVWFWSALSLRPWWIYVRHALDDDPSQWTFLGNHPFVMVCIVGVISGGLMLVRFFTDHRFGAKFAVFCTFLTFVAFCVGAVLSSLKIL